MDVDYRYESSRNISRRIDEAIGHMEAILMATSPNFCEDDARYLRNVFDQCKLQIEHLEAMSEVN